MGRREEYLERERTTWPAFDESLAAGRGSFGWSAGAVAAHVTFWMTRAAEALESIARGDYDPARFAIDVDAENDRRLPEWGTVSLEDGRRSLAAAAWSAFTEVLRRVPADRRAEEGVVPGWSAHDMIWHCGYWAGFVAGQLDGTGDLDDHDDGYWDALNAQVVVEARAMSWEESLARSERERAHVREALVEAAEPPSDVIEEFRDETFVHYREHTAEIESFLAG